MRLIRITSREPTATFDSTFNENLILPPNSKIALQSVSAGVERKELVLDGSNNGLKFQIGTTTERDGLDVEAGIYKATNVDVLLRYIQRTLNRASDYRSTDGTNKMIGVEWNADKDNDKKVAIGYGIGRYGAHTVNWLFTNTQFTGGVVNPTFKSLGTAFTTGSENNCILPFLLSKGTGIIRSRATTLIDGAAGDPEAIGYVIGITKNLDASGATLALADYLVAIHITIVGGNPVYRRFVDGVEEVASQTPADPANDFQEVGIFGGNFVSRYYRGGSQVPVEIGAPIPIPEGTFSGSQDNSVRPFFVFRGGNLHATCDAIRVTPSPYGLQPPDFAVPTSEVGAPPQPVDGTKGPNYFFFQSLELANFLGFPNQRIPITGTVNVNTITYTASSEFPIPQEADAFLVLLDNLQLDSYDSYSSTQEPSGGQRKNLLTVIPSSNETGTLVYEPSYPTFIDLNNQNPIFLRNIKARILRNDYSPVEVQGLSSIVLLVDN